MSEKNKPIKIEFAPGCFDQFDGTQEELDALQKEIMDMLTNMTPEELAESSRSIDFDEEELSDEDLAAFRQALTNTSTRNLQ